MPYIKKEFRPELDKHINALADVINNFSRKEESEAAYAGLLNYTCTRLAMAVVERRFGRIRYGVIATVTGVFKNIADEFYRRVAAPYEDKQISNNGDVDYYEKLG